MSDEKVMTVHSIPADFEAELGRDVAKTTEAAQNMKSRVESNVTAPNEAPGKPIADEDCIELATAPGAETPAIPPVEQPAMPVAETATVTK